MSLVFAGICSHAPGITGRAHMAEAALREPFYAAYRQLREQLLAARPEALIVVAAEHFANFFMNNMPSFAIGMADRYSGPIEDPAWLGIPRTSIPGNAALSQQLIREIMQTVDVAFAEEWRCDHGIGSCSIAGCATTRRRCCPIRTSILIATPARAVSRFAPSSASRQRPVAVDICNTTHRFRSLPSAAPLPRWTSPLSAERARESPCHTWSFCTAGISRWRRM